MCDPTNQPPSNITCSKHHRPYHSGRQRKQIRKRWRGSHQGYSGDNEAVAAASSDDEASARSDCAAASSSTYASNTQGSTPLNGQQGGTPMPFYRELPKRRSRNKGKSNRRGKDNTNSKSKHRSTSPRSKSELTSNQGIDLSQVRIVSCREYDLRLLKKEREFMKKVLYHHDIDPSDPSQSECDSSDSEKKLGYVSGPLAVVDHGPVFEFKKKVDSSCNLLNEMYNIGSLKDMDGSTNSMSPLLDSKKRTISSHFNLLHDKRHKRQHIWEKAFELKCGVEQTYLTMEEAVSFSPFARVIFDAEPPHTIVHINAAYGSLVSQHIVSASFVGQPLGNLSQTNGSKDIAAMVASHLQKIAPSLPPYQIFPVVSRLSDFHIFHAFRRLQCLGSSVMASIPPIMNYDNESLAAAGAKVIGNGSERDIDFVAYYMLQIESKSQIQQSPCPHNK